jgi:hypothetical protein
MSCGRSTIAVPLSALLAATVSAIVVAAQAGLAFCNNRIVIPLPCGARAGMAGMDMTGTAMSGMSMVALPGGRALMICPVVLVLIVASAALAAGAIVLLWRDPHRALTGRGIVRVLASLPPARTAGALALLGAGAVSAMLAVDGAGVPSWPVSAMLAALLAGGSLASALLSIAAGRIALAFARRLILAVAGAFARARGGVAPRAQRLVPLVAGVRAASLLAAGRGLRAPPSVMR